LFRWISLEAVVTMDCTIDFTNLVSRNTHTTNSIFFCSHFMSGHSLHYTMFHKMCFHSARGRFLAAAIP
jgi:hypothetical protein